MYTVFYNCETTPIRLLEWLDDMAKKGRELVAVFGQLFFFKSAVELSCEVEQDVRLTRMGESG